MATSMIWAVLDSDYPALGHFGVAVLMTGVAGLVLHRLGGEPPVLIRPREAVATVAIGWFLIGAFGAVPYLLQGALTHPADAFFESVSGFTTTGASVATDVEAFSRALLWWRSLTQWMGGIGIVVLFIAIFPNLGIGAARLFRSEVPGHITERLRPKLRHSSLVLWYIYAGLTAAQAAFLIFAGVAPFHAICHAFTTLATGGYSTLNASIAGFQSLPVELIVMLFMFLAGVNFALYFRLAEGKARAFWSDSEFRAYCLIVGVSIIVVTLAILPQKGSLGDAIRYGAFSVLTTQTVTGYATDDFDLYPEFARFLLFVLVFFGGCTGSTAGGLKIARILIIARGILNEILRRFRPHAVLIDRIGGTPLDRDVVRSVYVFFGAFVGLLVFGTIVMTAFGLDIVSAGSAVITCMSNCGPGLGLVGPVRNYAFLPAAGKVFLSVVMILGRLEILTVMALVMPAFWRR